MKSTSTPKFKLPHEDVINSMDEEPRVPKPSTTMIEVDPSFPARKENPQSGMKSKSNYQYKQTEDYSFLKKTKPFSN